MDILIVQIHKQGYRSFRKSHRPSKLYLIERRSLLVVVFCASVKFIRCFWISVRQVGSAALKNIAN